MCTVNQLITSRAMNSHCLSRSVSRSHGLYAFTYNYSKTAINSNWDLFNQRLAAIKPHQSVM